MIEQINRIVLGLWIFCLSGLALFSQHSSRNNYTGNWATPASWNPTWTVPQTNISGYDITINGYITIDDSLSFSSAASNLVINDTLVIKGDLSLDNNNDLTINDNGILIVRGNLTIGNQTLNLANGYLIVTGNIIKISSINQGSFVSNDSPEKVFIGGTISLAGLTDNNPDYAALNCTVPVTNPYPNSTCSYGNMTDLKNDPIYPFFLYTCVNTHAGSNSPVCVGNTINLTSTGGTGYSWSGPNGFTSSTQNPSIPNASTAMAGTYTVNVTAATGCTASETTNLIVNALPTATSGSNSPVCEGNTINLTSSGGTGYSWSGPNGFTSSTQNPSLPNANTSMAGTSTVTITAATGCTVTETTNLIVNALPTATSGSNSPVCEENTIFLTSSGGTGYSWSGPNGFTSSTQNPSITNVSTAMAGTYTVSVIAATGCTVTKTTNVIVNILPIASAGSNSPVCEENTIFLTSSGGTGYSWSGPNGFTSSTQNPSITNVSTAMAGTYTVSVIAATGCIVTTTTSIIINALPTATVGSNSPVCEENTIFLTSSGGTGYSWSGPNGFTSSAQNPSIPNASTAIAGTYTVTITATTGCIVTRTTSLIINALPTVNVGSNSPVCEGNPINLSSSGGTFYNWSGPNSFLSSMQNPSIPNANTAMAGTYTVTVTSATGCTVTKTTSLIINALPIATVGSNSPVCEGNTINLTSSGGIGYSWSGPDGFTSSAQNPWIPNASTALTGTYTVTITAATGCIVTRTTNIIINALPTVNVGSNSPVCEGNTINLSSSGGTFYIWSGPNSFLSSMQNPSIPNANTAMAGTYTVTVTTAAACTNTETINIVVGNTTPIVIVGSNSPVCVGNTINLTSSGGAGYSWNGPYGFISSIQDPSIPNVSSSMAGTYTVTVTAATGCAETETINVTVNPLPTVTANSNSPVCVGNTINLTSSGGTGYSWSGPDGFTSSLPNLSIPDANIAMAGVYTVIVTAINGCSDTETINVILPITTSGSNSPVCEGNTINLTSPDGTGYNWRGPNGFTSNTQNPSIPNANTAMAGIYTVTVTIAAGCTDTGKINVIVNILPTAYAGSNSPVCVGNTIILTSSGGTGYGWSGPDGFTSSAQDPIIRNANSAMAGVYKVTATSVTGCSGTDTVNLVVNALPVPNAGSNSPVCEGDSINLTSSGGKGYSWSGPNGFISDLQNPSIPKADTAMAGIYKVILLSSIGCKGIDSINLIVNALPIAFAGSNSPVCLGKTINLTSKGGTEYNWSGPKGFKSGVKDPFIQNSDTTMAGSYMVTVTDATGCTVTKNTNLIINTLPIAFADSNSPVCERNTINLASSGGISYSWIGPNGFNNSSQNPSISNANKAMSGNYKVTVTAATGCTVSETTNIIVKELPTIIVGSNSPVCEGSTINFSSSGGTSYSWSGPNGFTSSEQNPSIPNTRKAISGVYTVTVTAATGCTDSETINVIVNSLPTITLASNSPVCEGNTINLTSSGGTSYIWSSPNGFTSNVKNPSFSNADNTMAGTYTVTVTTPTGCTDSKTIKVIVNPLPDITAGSNSPVCEGSTINFTSSGGTGYSWSGPNGFSSNAQNPSLPNTKTDMEGVYTVTVTANNGCANSDTINIIINVLPVTIIGSNSPICEGSPISLTSSGEGDYCWSGPNGFTSSVQNPSLPNANTAMTGTYKVIVTTNHGCTNTDSINIIINTLPTAIAGSNSPVCEGNTINLTSLGGTSYSWIGPNSFASDLQNTSIPNAKMDMAGAYTVTVTTTSGCTDTDTINLLINALPIVTAGSNSPVCEGNTINLTSSGGTVYSWVGPQGFASNEQNSSIQNAGTLMAGTYTVTVTATNSCTNTDTTNLIVNSLPIAKAGSNSPVCEGNNINFTSSGGTGYSWSGPNGFTSNNQNPLITNANSTMAGAYILTLTTVAGCKNADTINIIVNNLPNTAISSNSPVCEGNTINLTSSGGSGFNWSGPNGFTSNLQNPSLPNTKTAMAGTYTVTITAATGCIDTDTVHVLINPLPTIIAGSNSPVCEGTTINLTSSGGIDYSWSGLTGFSSNLQNPLITNANTAMAGAYTVTVKSSTGCDNTNTINIIVNKLPTAIAGNNSPVCEGNAINLTSSGGTDYSWEGPNGFKSNIQNPLIPNAIQTMTGSYILTVTDATSCTNTDTINLIINELPIAIATNDSPVCEGSSINLTSSGGMSYSWSGPNSFTSNIQDQSILNTNPSMSGDYVVKVTALNGCTDTAITRVIVNALPVVNITSSNSMCLNDLLTLSGTPAGGTFTQLDGPGMVTSNVLSAIGIGFINIKYTYSDVCTNYTTQSVIVNENPHAFAGPDQKLKFIFETEMKAELFPDETGEWSLISGSGNISDINSPKTKITELSGGENIFLWKVWKSNCQVSSKVTISVYDPFVPSVITPNGDGKNDYFKISEILGQVELIIFDRWGNVEYTNSNYSNDWDGLNNRGMKLPNDTYFCILKFDNGKIKKGSVLITR